MNQIDQHHETKRTTLRIAGPIIAGIGLIFIIVGTATFFAGDTRLFWCNFVGVPLLFVGAAMSGLGFMGAMQRYAAGESAPVAKDTLNYVADGTQEGVKTVARAVGEGLREAAAPGVRCPKCNQLNPTSAKFCNNCGSALA